MNALDRLDMEVEGWKPEIGDKVYGEIVTIDSRPSDYGDPYPYLEIEDQISGKLIGVHAFHSVLKRDIARQKPQVGDMWGAKYLGEKETKRTDSRGNTSKFEHYNTTHESKTGEAPPSPNFDAMGADADAELGTDTQGGVDYAESWPAGDPRWDGEETQVDPDKF